jgi:hypothetical protein
MTTLNIKIFQPTEQRANVVGDQVFKQLAAMTPVQIDTYLLNNVTTMAQARTVLSILARAVVYLLNKDRA